MRSRYVLIALVLVALGFGVGRLSAAVGTTDSPAVPENTLSFTLEDIYNRLNDGTAGAQSTFTEPAAGPGTGTMQDLNDIMGKAPAADNTDGATKAEVANCKKYWSLRTDGSGGSSWGLETGTAPQYVAKTGQTGCWNSSGGSISCTGTGQDGEYRNGGLPIVAPSSGWSFGGYNRASFTCSGGFTDNGNGTVTDNLTGLIWLKNANCSTFFSGDSTGQNNRRWSEALTAANSLANGYCGLSDGSTAGDWRLPNINELRSLFDPGLSAPYLPAGHPFTGVQSDYYWASTTHAYTRSYAWYVYLTSGLVNVYNKANYSFYVWPVRGGQ
jgi:hypothetical protein